MTSRPGRAWATLLAVLVAFAAGVGGALYYSNRNAPSPSRRADPDNGTPATPSARVSALGRLQPAGGVIPVYGPPGDRIKEMKPLNPGDTLKAGDPIDPFLIDRGYDEVARGVALGTVSLVSTLAGTALGGIMTNVLGLGRALWVFGGLQVFSNLGYVLLARSPVDAPLTAGTRRSCPTRPPSRDAASHTGPCSDTRPWPPWDQTPRERPAAPSAMSDCPAP